MWQIFNDLFDSFFWSFVNTVTFYRTDGNEPVLKNPNVFAKTSYNVCINEEITVCICIKQYYKLNNDTVKWDLYWNPDVNLDNGNNKSLNLSFYNNDFAKKYRIIIQGIKTDGTPVYIEKTVE